MSAVRTPEDELTFLVAGTRERRLRSARRIEALAARIDWDRFAAGLTARNLLPLVGTRLLESEADVRVPSSFRTAVEARRAHQRHHGALVEVQTRRLWTILEEAGIRTVVLKGPFLAEQLYGDLGLRSTTDVDLLVTNADFVRARSTLEELGYCPARGGAWRGGLPLFETTLRSPHPWSPPVDLHWRVHWYEEAFSADLIARAQTTGDQPRRLSGADQLAAMLLFYCRDGFTGARPTTDIGAWWDAHGADWPADGLAPLADAHPQLAPAFAAALLAADQQVGVPAAHVLARSWAVSSAARRAARLASWGSADPLDLQAAVALTDLLLAIHGDRSSAMQRHLFPPTEAIARIYDLQSPRGLARAARGVRFAGLVGARLLPRQARALWQTRHDQPLSPVLG